VLDAMLRTSEELMSVADVLEMIRLRSRHKHSYSYTLDWAVSPPVIIDASQVIDVLDESLVVCRQPERQPRYLEIIIVHFIAWPLSKELSL